MGLALAVMARLVAAAPAIPGALIYALGPRLPEADAVRAELAAES